MFHVFPFSLETLFFLILLCFLQIFFIFLLLLVATLVASCLAKLKTPIAQVIAFLRSLSRATAALGIQDSNG